MSGRCEGWGESARGDDGCDLPTDLGNPVGCARFIDDGPCEQKVADRRDGDSDDEVKGEVANDDRFDHGAFRSGM